MVTASATAQAAQAPGDAAPQTTAPPSGTGANASGAAVTQPPNKIYLDSYLETVGSLPAEAHRWLNTLRDIDERMRDMEEDAKQRTDRCLSLPAQSSRNTAESQKETSRKLRGEIDRLHDTLNILSNEKIELVRKAMDVLDAHIDNLDEDLIKFEEEITLNTAQSEIEQYQQRQEQALAQRDRLLSGHAGLGDFRSHHEDDISHVSQGDQVAARISNPGNPDEWILARVMNIANSNNKSMFTILDEDAEEGGTSSIHHLSYKQIIALPHIKERKGAVLFGEGQTVLAVFPQTTVFYRALVVQAAKWQPKNSSWGFYLLAFDDDEDPNKPGYQAHRSVAFQYVVPLPLDFKLG